ncbi:cilia- and flagella-associated protein 263 isoform X2 [Vanacampus margaritifer]
MCLSNQGARSSPMEKKSNQDRQPGFSASIQQLQNSNAAVLAENELFESFIIRLDQHDLLTQPAGLGVAGSQVENRKSEDNLPDGLQQLTLAQKLCLAQREIAQMIREQQNDKERSERILANYKASIKEIELQRADIRKDKNDFEHRLLKPMKMSERKEPEKVLHDIRSKEKLQRMTQESAQLSSDITKRKEVLEKIEEDILRAEQERSKAEAQNKQLLHQMSTYQAPDVAQYMHVKYEHKMLQRSVHTWQRKVGIAEMTSKSKFWSQRGGSSVKSDDAGTADNQVKLPYIAQHGKA